MRLTIGLLVASFCVAQEMPMAKPAPEMKVLTSLVGTWDVEEHVQIPQEMKGKGVATFTSGPGDLSVLMEYKSATSPFRGYGIMTWDPNEKAYKTVWVDNMTPGTVVQIGRKQGEKYVYTGEVWMDKQKSETRDEVEITPGKMTTTSFLNGKKAMTLLYTKRQ